MDDHSKSLIMVKISGKKIVQRPQILLHSTLPIFFKKNVERNGILVSPQHKRLWMNKKGFCVHFVKMTIVGRIE